LRHDGRSARKLARREKMEIGGMTNFFFPEFGFEFLPSYDMESTSTYRGWKKDDLSLFRTNLSP
jgi:hypothetical protein